MSRTGIVTALTAEARVLSPANAKLLIVSGMGPAAATRAAQDLVAAGAQGLVSFGLAGALDPQLRAGTVILPHHIADGAGRVLAAYEPWRDRLAAAVAGGADHPATVGGTLLSVAQPLTTGQSKAQARAATGGCAVDMESFAIAHVAAQKGVRFLVARVIIDGATDVLPRSVIRATDAFGAVSLTRLLLGLARAPTDLPALLRLPARYRAALRALRALGALDLGLS